MNMNENNQVVVLRIDGSWYMDIALRGLEDKLLLETVGMLQKNYQDLVQQNWHYWSWLKNYLGRENIYPISPYSVSLPGFWLWTKGSLSLGPYPWFEYQE
jgi:hypothetical protein